MVPGIWTVVTGLEGVELFSCWFSVSLRSFCTSSNTWKRRARGSVSCLLLQLQGQRFSCCLCFWFSRSALTITCPHLNVQLEGSDGLLQHAAPLLLRELHAVHPAAVELLEAVGAGDSEEGKERQTLLVLQPQGLLGHSNQDLAARQVSEVPGVSVGL